MKIDLYGLTGKQSKILTLLYSSEPNVLFYHNFNRNFKTKLEIKYEI